MFFFFFLNKTKQLFRLHQLRTRVCTRAPASRAFLIKKKKKTESPLWSVELHQTQASTYKAVMFASRAQLCQRALQAPPLRSSLRDEKPAVDLCPSVAVRQLMV